jgi:hypothetical protein
MLPAMSERFTIVGSYLSPYVRKVLVCLHVKGIPYQIRRSRSSAACSASWAHRSRPRASECRRRGAA